MSGLFADFSSWIPLGVLVASIVGSPHCVSMCGGLVLSIARDRKSWTLYHLGRLTGYLGLGGVAGFLGSQVLGSGAATWISWCAALAMGLGLIVTGARAWRGESLHFSIVPRRVLQRLYRLSRGSVFLSGALTALLPCGWLHTFVLGAVATQSPWRGGGFLLAFWVGTLPALGFAPWIMDRLIRPISIRTPKVSAVILIAVGILSVSAKIWSVRGGAPESIIERSCH